MYWDSGVGFVVIKRHRNGRTNTLLLTLSKFKVKSDMALISVEDIKLTQHFTFSPGPWKNPAKHAFGANWNPGKTPGIGYDLAPASTSVNPSNANVNVVSGININGSKRKSPKQGADRRKRPDTSGRKRMWFRARRIPRRGRSGDSRP